MSRASTQTAQDTDQERASIDATNAQLLSQQNSVGNSATSGYQNMLADPGYTQAQQAAITGATQGSLGSAFDALSQSAADRVEVESSTRRGSSAANAPASFRCECQLAV